MPASRNCLMPLPATCLSGSMMPTTTREIFASMITCVHGPVFPVWLHGSSVVYNVAPWALWPAALSATTSACAPPGCIVAPQKTWPSVATTTAPTHGFGRLRKRASTAVSTASRIMRSSSRVIAGVSFVVALQAPQAGQGKDDERNAYAAAMECHKSIP